MNVTKLVFTIFGIFLFCFSSCKQEVKQTIKTTPIEFKKEGELTIYKAKTDSIITSFDIEIADTDYETQTGLMYRKAMKSNRGMLFVFPEVSMHSFYMKNTEIPLDIIFIDENLQIASFQKNAEPFNETGLSSKVPVRYVLELNAGISEKFHLKEKDSISFTKL
tara:strand:- start:60720 stop:61211 length:492 start_codon:yes stop_codon:yes gene_type:complete